MPHVLVSKFSESHCCCKSFMVSLPLYGREVPMVAAAGSTKGPPITVVVDEIADAADKASSCLL